MENKAKYNVGDKVCYLDICNDKKFGTINEVIMTDNDYEWSKESEPLYLMSCYPFLRNEKHILGYKEDYAWCMEA